MAITTLPDSALTAPGIRRGRGAVSAAVSRYDPYVREGFDDGWDRDDDAPPPLATTVQADTSRTVIARNTSPDIPFDRSINPYRGCEHGCIYCFARPSHAWLGLSPGLDFETRIMAKFDAPALLEQELARSRYRVAPMAMGTNTDPYQPVERKYGIMRGILRVLSETRHPLSIVTKSHLVTRDIDILSGMAQDNLVRVFVSVTTLDHKLARTMEPRAATPQRRLDAVRKLNKAGIPTGVMVAPIVPALTDHEMEAILTAARDAGAVNAGYILLRLPLEVKTLFKEWLEEHYPDRASRIMNRVRGMRNGAENDSTFGRRMRGQGAEADFLSLRFRRAVRRLGLDRRLPSMATNLFRPPGGNPRQLDLL